MHLLAIISTLKIYVPYPDSRSLLLDIIYSKNEIRFVEMLTLTLGIPIRNDQNAMSKRKYAYCTTNLILIGVVLSYGHE